MLRILLIRHGDTDWNIGEIFRGRADIELNETGILQAELLAEYLKKLPLKVVYSSPLKRALKTAEIIAKLHNIRVLLSQELIDFDYGEWQSLSVRVVRRDYGRTYNNWLENPHLVRIPGGESLSDVRKRVSMLINQIIAVYKRGTVVLVSHRVIHKVLICLLLGLSNSHFWKIKLDTCGITTFIYDNQRFILEGHNDTSFLKSIYRRTCKDF